MSALDGSVTLEDVFGVVAARRVPLAPELAGYLALEIADGTDAGSGDVDPRNVFISEEGTVALVRPKRDVVTGEAESSIRTVLAKLLDASGSSTPALQVAARRKPGNGLPALVEELEAALIPVNRAAGRRALARLAREVKRVLMGVGRNASAPPSGAPAVPPPKQGEPPSGRTAPHARPVIARARPRGFDDEAATIPKRNNPISELPAGAPRGLSPLPPPPGRPASGPPAPPPPPTRHHDKLFGGDEVESLLDTFEVSNLHGEKQLSRDLKAIAGMSPTPPPPDASAIDALVKDVGKDLSKGAADSPNAEREDGVEALLALADASGPLAPPLPPPGFPAKPDVLDIPPPVNAPPAPPPPAPPAHAAAASSPPRVSAPTSTRPTATTTGGHRARSTKGAAKGQPRRPKTSLALLVILLTALLAGVGVVWLQAPRLFTGKRRPVASASASAVPVAAPVPKCKVGLVVRDAPRNAEILLRMGQAPLDVERMPVGTRLELVATAEGYAPKRAVIKADASWENGPDGKPRIDVPIQLDPSKAKPGAVDPWPGAEPGSNVGGSGSPGTVHVVSNVRGAEIWLLAGLGPEARIEQLRCDGDIDVLLAAAPDLRKRLHVAEKEIQAAEADAQGNKVVTISAK